MVSRTRLYAFALQVMESADLSKYHTCQALAEVSRRMIV